MAFRDYIVRIDSIPPDPDSAVQEARWLQLGDSFLGQGRTAQTLPRTRAHHDHERLLVELHESLNKIDRGDILEEVFGHGQNGSRSHQGLAAKARSPECSNHRRERRGTTQAGGNRTSRRRIYTEFYRDALDTERLYEGNK